MVMDTLRGTFDASDINDDAVDFDLGEEEAGRDLPPAAIGQDERRMQVRAYNHWASTLGDRNFPSIEVLEPEKLDDFGPYSVLLDFSQGIEDPLVQFLGDEIAAECGTDDDIAKLSDVPARSLLSRITDHYMQILANQAPIGFEAEFVNQRGLTIMYRGILLPYSSDDDTIDFIYGVINWKEIADQVTADELLLEIDQALEVEEEDEPQKHNTGPVTDWADVPSEDEKVADIGAQEPQYSSLAPDDADTDLPLPDFGQYGLDDEDEDEEGEEEANYDFASLTDHISIPEKKTQAIDLDALDANNSGESVDGEEPADDWQANARPNIASDPSIGFDEGAFGTPFEPAAEDNEAEAEFEQDSVEPVEADEAPQVVAPEVAEAETAAPEVVEPEVAAPLAPTLPVADFDEPDDVLELSTEELSDDAGLYDYLASARELAQTANNCEDRSRNALYAAVGRAYDFSIAAKEQPEDYNELVAESGLSIQERAPMTPIVKLVFGAEYDKTRLTEYATVLSHAHRIGVERGSLANFLAEAEGGLKGTVAAERQLRREEAGKSVEPADSPREALAKKLREIAPLGFEDIPAEGDEFALVMIRRTEEGDVVVLGEIERDIPLIERAARKLVA